MIYDNSITAFYVYFNEISLNDSTSKVLDLDAYSTPRQINNSYKLARTDGEVVTATYYGSKNITVKGRIKASNRNELDTLIDTFKSKLVGYGKNLDIKMNNVVRRYNATVSDSSYTIRDSCICLWEITFLTNGIGYDSTTTALTFGTYTASNTSYSNTIGGTYKTYPYMEFLINSCLPYWEYRYIEIKNGVTNEYLRINKEYHYNDKIVVNGATKKILAYTSSSNIISSMDTVADNSTYSVGPLADTSVSIDTSIKTQGIGSILMNHNTGAAISPKGLIIYSYGTNKFDMSQAGAIMCFAVYIPTPIVGTHSSLQIYLSSNISNPYQGRYYNITQQYNGAAFALDSWNYFKIVIDTYTSQTLPFDKSAINSVILNFSGNSGDRNLYDWDNARADYFVSFYQSPIAEEIDYEGLIPSLNTGADSLVITDTLDSRNITITGNYTKRYL